MRSVVGEIEEKWLRRVAIDKGLRLAGEGIGQILGLNESCLAAQNGCIHVGGRAVDEAEKLIETPSQRMQVHSRTQMPFADRAGDVARRFEQLRQDQFLKGKP